MDDGHYFYNERIILIDDGMAFEIAQGPYIQDVIPESELVKILNITECKRCGYRKKGGDPKMKYFFTVLCAWCWREMPPIPADKPGLISRGICRVCTIKYFPSFFVEGG